MDNKLIFKTNIDKTEFDNFVKTNPHNNHFMQSAAWGEFSETKGYQSHYVGLYEDNQLIATSLCLVKKLQLNKKYMYITKGFVLDYHNIELLKYFNDKIIEFARSLSCFYIKIDPNIILSKLDNDANRIEDSNLDIISNFEELGYIHLGFTKEFETTQPRYTFQINLDDDFKKRINKGFVKNVKKSHNYDVEIIEGNIDDVEYLHDLIRLTAKRDSFTAYSLNYYKNYYKILSEYDMAKLYLGVVYPEKIISKHENNLLEYSNQLTTLKELETPTKKQVAKILDLEKRTSKTTKELDVFKQYENRFADGFVVSAHMISMYGETATALYAGSHNLFNETFVNNRIYFEKLHNAKEAGYKYFDQFGTTGNPVKGNHLYGIHKFKQQFGGDYIEYIGEFDYVLNKTWYHIYTKYAPKLRKLLTRKHKQSEQCIEIDLNEFILKGRD